MFRFPPRPRSWIALLLGENISVRDVRDLRGVIERENAAIGILVTVNRPTAPMKREAAGTGFCESPLYRAQHPRMQILTVDELLKGATINMPPRVGVRTFKKSPKRRADAEDALKLLLKVLEATPDDVDALHAAGRAASTLGLIGEACTHWKRTLELQPKHEAVLVDLVALEHKAGNLQAGPAYVDRLIEINPWRADFHGSRAQKLGQLRQFKQGIQSAKRALGLNPSMQSLCGWLAGSYRLFGMETESQFHALMSKWLAPRE